MRARKNPDRQALALANQAEEQVLGLDRNATQLASFVAGEEENSSGPFGIPFEHPGYLRENRWCWGLGDDDHIIRHLKGVSPTLLDAQGPATVHWISGARPSDVRFRGAACDRTPPPGAGCASRSPTSV